MVSWAALPPQTHLGSACNIHGLHDVCLQYLGCVFAIFSFQEPERQLGRQGRSLA